LFNHRHLSLRAIVERIFWSLKRRFKILNDAIPFPSFPTQVDIVVACCIIYNWVIEDRGDEFIIPETVEISSINLQRSAHGQAMEHAFMVDFRQQFANVMWEGRQQYHGKNT
jgi:hypothetical protein